MPWDKDPDKAFPAHHPREPGGLRQDILDEIADHLACAAEVEGEGQDEGNEASAWRRALERFGDPDAVARRLWWDAMRETVMREWIQTGVMIVAAAAVVVGVVFMGVMLARVGTANEMMQTALQQVSKSNHAMTQAMEEQRKGNEALLAMLSKLPGGAEPAPALELSTIELVLRRGSKQGPPAPDVEVTMEGKGPNDETMTVRAEPDAEGRARFEQLYQGSYRFRFYDPVSGLGAQDTITLFAGRGAGEHVIVVPDVEPRAVHLELELPAYGRDDELLISVGLTGRWVADGENSGTVWQAEGGAYLGHSGTWDEPPGFGESKNGSSIVPENGESSDTERFSIAGAVSISGAGVLERDPGGGTRTVRQRRDRQTSNDAAMELTLTREDDTGDYYTLANAEYLVNLYGEAARLLRSREFVTDNTHDLLLRNAAAVLEDSVVVDAGGPLKQRMARYRDGLFFESVPGGVGVHSNYYGDGGIASVALVTIPELTAVEHGMGGSVYLALPIDKLQKYDLDFGQRGIAAPPNSTTRRPIGATTRMRPLDNLVGNRLLAFAIRAPWDGVIFPEYDRESDVSGFSLDVDAEPFWQFSSEALEEGRTVGTLFVPVPPELLAAGAAPVTGVMLRWEYDTEGFYWALELDGGHSWVLTKPLPPAGEAGSNRPLNDLNDGRLHLDSIRFGAPEIDPSQPGVSLQPKDE